LVKLLNLQKKTMRVVIQRVNKSELWIDEKLFSSINKGLLVLVGFEEFDNQEDVEWTANKIAGLRIFSDAEGKMNLDVNQIAGEALVVSQFTLFAATKKGNRPSFIRSAKPEIAIPLYESFILQLGSLIHKPIKTGQFGADMKIQLVNDGPVTITMDSKNKE
jgi:D-tyrosyl-tRNA(Tyr) deacylase